jgi:hypothetical protein
MSSGGPSDADRLTLAYCGNVITRRRPHREHRLGPHLSVMVLFRVDLTYEF